MELISENVVFIYRPIEENELKLIKDLPIENTILYYNQITNITSTIQHYTHVKDRILPQMIRASNRKLLDDLLNFSGKNIGDKRVVDLLGFERFNWWYYNKFRIFYQWKSLFYTFAHLKQYAEKGKNVFVFSDVNYQHYFEFPKGLKVFTSTNETKTKPNYFSLISYVLAFFIRGFLGFFQSIRLTSPKHYFLDNPLSQKEILNPTNLKPMQTNLYLGYLLKKYPDRIVSLQELYHPTADSTINYLNHLRSNPFEGQALFLEYVLLKSICNPFVWIEVRSIAKMVQKNIALIFDKKSTTFEKSILTFLVNLDKSMYYYIFRYVAFKRFFRNRKNCLSITTINELGCFYKVILDAAKLSDISTFGVQHGAFLDFDPDYAFTKYDIETHFPMPDYTFLWGKKWKNILIENANYQPSSIKLSGQIQTDIIPHLTAERREKAESTILFVSQIHEPNYRREVLNILFEGLKDILKAGNSLVIRLHPRETMDDLWQETAEKYGVTNYRIDSSIALYEQLKQVDLVITVHSIVGAEAIYFNKPLITIDINREDLINFVKDGIASQVTNSAELNQIAKQLLSEELEADRKKFLNLFVQENAYKIDGHVSDRIMNTIEEVVDRRFSHQG